MRKFLFYFAVTGWTLGLVVHILSLANIDVAEKIPFIWILHIGIFVVWIPVVMDFKKNEEFKTYQQSGILKRMNPLDFFKINLRNSPRWLMIIAIVGFFYAIGNFMLYIFSEHGTPAIKDGQFVLLNHGQLVKALTEKEYEHYKANDIRGFSGHWIAFYGIAMALLYPFKGQVQNNSLQSK